MKQIFFLFLAFFCTSCGLFKKSAPITLDPIAVDSVAVDTVTVVDWSDSTYRINDSLIVVIYRDTIIYVEGTTPYPDVPVDSGSVVIRYEQLPNYTETTVLNPGTNVITKTRTKTVFVEVKVPKVVPNPTNGWLGVLAILAILTAITFYLKYLQARELL